MLLELAAACGLFCCASLLFQTWLLRRPFPEYGGNVTHVHSLDQWNQLLASSLSQGKLVLLDCYATWCPPCRAAAPAFAKLSLRYRNVVFAKLDVDASRQVASDLGVTAMPTFFLFRSGSQGKHEVNSVRGFQHALLLEMLVKNGAVESTSDEGEGEASALLDSAV